jgi:hypothetical protein
MSPNKASTCWQYSGKDKISMIKHAKDKYTPWLYDEEAAFFGKTSHEENLEIIRRRNLLDSNFGALISPEVVFDKKWSISVVSCNDSEEEEFFLKKIFDGCFFENSISYMLPIRGDRRDTYFSNGEIEKFHPALIASFEMSYENYRQLRLGMIPIFSENFFILSKNEEFAYIFVKSGYHLFASAKDIIENIWGRDFENMWKSTLLESYNFDYIKNDLLRAAKIYGYA